jgi:hypothetical protein
MQKLTQIIIHINVIIKVIKNLEFNTSVNFYGLEHDNVMSLIIPKIQAAKTNYLYHTHTHARTHT